MDSGKEIEGLGRFDYASFNSIEWIHTGVACVRAKNGWICFQFIEWIPVREAVELHERVHLSIPLNGFEHNIFKVSR